MESDIKKSFLENYKEQKAIITKIDKATGEIKNKEFKANNKGKGIFTYIPPKNSLRIDKNAILVNEKFKDFTKIIQQVVIDDEKVQKEIEKNGYKNLPIIEEIIPAKSGHPI